jgi:hypothetical protein
MLPTHRRSSSVARWALTCAVAVVGVIVTASCNDDRPSYADCDSVVRRCQTVCNYWCDGWGCYPTCYEQCWDDCYQRAPRGTPGPDAPLQDASLPPPPADAGSTPAPSNDAGVLCSACVSTADCAAGSLCILRGGAQSDAAPPDAGGAGFCSRACGSATDCPEGFACSQIGASRQCLPRRGTCE